VLWQSEDVKVTVLRVIGGGKSVDTVHMALEFGLSQKVQFIL
jgi:hypothetical protein